MKGSLMEEDNNFIAEIITVMPPNHHITPVYDEESGNVYGWVIVEDNKEITSIIESIEDLKNWENFIII